MLKTETYLPMLKQFEGNYSFMYLDTTGNVTVGVGFELPNVKAAQKLPFVRRPCLVSVPPVLPGPATLDEIKADFQSVDAQPSGRFATYYRPLTKLDLPKVAIDSILNAEVATLLKSLKADFPDYDSYPEQACAALFDMAYNLGLGMLTSQFTSFCAAIKARDWATAASECHRKGIQTSRNEWTKAQLLKAAASMPKTAPSASVSDLPIRLP